MHTLHTLHTPYSLRPLVGHHDTALPAPGSSLGAGVARGLEMFVDEERENKVMVLVSDGEDLEGEFEEAVRQAKEADVVVHTVGVGSEKGEPVPDFDRGQDAGSVLWEPPMRGATARAFGDASGRSSSTNGRVISTTSNAATFGRSGSTSRHWA